MTMCVLVNGQCRTSEGALNPQQRLGRRILGHTNDRGFLCTVWYTKKQLEVSPDTVFIMGLASSAEHENVSPDHQQRATVLNRSV